MQIAQTYNVYVSYFILSNINNSHLKKGSKLRTVQPQLNTAPIIELIIPMSGRVHVQNLYALCGEIEFLVHPHF